MARQIFQQIENYLQRAEYHSALELLNRSKSILEVNFSNKLYGMFLECLIHELLGNQEKKKLLAKDLLDESQKGGIFLREIDAISFIISTTSIPQEIPELEAFIKKGTELLKTYHNENDDEFLIREAFFYYCLGDYYYFSHGDQLKSFEYYTLGVTKRQQVHKPSFLLDYIYYRSFLDLGYFYMTQGQQNKALELLQEGLEKTTKFGDIRLQGIYFNLLGGIFREKGEFQTALQYMEKAMTLSKESGNLKDVVISLTNIGVIHDKQGNYDEALAFFHQAISVCEEINFKWILGGIQNNIGRIYAVRGDFEEAFEYILKGMKLLREENNAEMLLISYFAFGELLAEIGNIEDSIEHLTKGRIEAKKLGNKHTLSRFLYSLIRIKSEIKEEEDMKSLLDEFRELFTSSDNKLISQQYRIAEALTWKMSDRVPDKMRALSNFTLIGEEPIIRIEQTADAIINLCDLLLYEYKISGVKIVLNEVKSWLNKLVNIAESQNNYIILSETYLVQSMVALMELEPEKAQELQEKALSIAKERKIYRLTKKISEEKQKLTENLSKWKLYSTQQISIGEIFELTQIDNIVSQMLSRRLDLKEDYKLKTHYAQLAKDLYNELEGSKLFEKD